MLTSMLMGAPFNLTPAQAAQNAPLYANAFVAHCAVDEAPDALTRAALLGLLADPNPSLALLGAILTALWTDLPPADNTLSVSLAA
jgi:hypothetical protein